MLAEYEVSYQAYVEDRVGHCCRDENEPRSDLNTTI